MKIIVKQSHFKPQSLLVVLKLELVGKHSNWNLSIDIPVHQNWCHVLPVRDRLYVLIVHRVDSHRLCWHLSKLMTRLPASFLTNVHQLNIFTFL